MENKRQTILNTVSDLTLNFLVYDRKGDESLSRKDLKEAFANGVVTVDEVIALFKKEIEATLPTL